MKLFLSDWIGIVLGCALGVTMPFVIFDLPGMPKFSGGMLLTIVVLGIAIPPAMAAAIKDMPTKKGIRYKMGRYVNSYLLFTVFGITTGVVGLSYYLVAGDIPQASLLPICCFGSAGVGNLVACFVNPKLAFRSDMGT